MDLVVRLSDIASIVKQCRDDTQDRALRSEPLLGQVSTFIGDDQTCNRERSVQGVLQIVIDGVAAVIAGKLTVGEELVITEGGIIAVDVVERHTRLDEN